MSKGGGAALPAQPSVQHSNSDFKHCSHCHQQFCTNFQPVPGCQPHGGTPSACQGGPLSDSCSAFQGVGHGNLPLPPLPLVLQIPTTAAGAPGEAVPGAHGPQQLLPPWGEPSACGGSTGHGKETAGHLGSVVLGLAQNGDGDRCWAGKLAITSWIRLGMSWSEPASAKTRKVYYWGRVGVSPFSSLCVCEVWVSQNTNDAEHFVPGGIPAAVRGHRGAGPVRGAPLGEVLTPRERALLRTADPTAGRLPVEGEPPRQPLPPQGLWEPPRELREAHERQVAEIRARTRQLERQREGLCQRLAALGARAAAGPQPEQGEPEPSQGPRDQPGQVPAAQHRATLQLDSLLPPAGPLAAEARALRLSYLRSGGHDPAILEQLLHLQLEATVLEEGTAGLRRARRMEPPGTGTHGLDAALLAVELENRRLEDELLALKVRRERRAEAVTKSCCPGSRAAQRHTEELAQLQAEVGMLRCHAEQTRPWLHPPVFPHLLTPQLPPALAVPELFMEPLGPALGPGRPAAHVPPGLPLTPFVALEDPPPAQEPPAQDRAPQR
ncbi:coiled-coil domain-containing protein 17 isoform X2 [Taeniopygia guttata]|uniref:coiled-coil domain-containing protein 17 isoform X2 n=1 Tax=Taeniopygia guttata TaxID=59729 RepID=UPI003BB9656F